MERVLLPLLLPYSFGLAHFFNCIFFILLLTEPIATKDKLTSSSSSSSANAIQVARFVSSSAATAAASSSSSSTSTQIILGHSDSHVTAQVGHPAYLKCAVSNLASDQAVNGYILLRVRLVNSLAIHVIPSATSSSSLIRLVWSLFFFFVPSDELLIITNLRCHCHRHLFNSLRWRRYRMTHILFFFLLPMN